MVQDLKTTPEGHRRIFEQHDINPEKEESKLQMQKSEEKKVPMTWAKKIKPQMDLQSIGSPTFDDLT